MLRKLIGFTCSIDYLGLPSLTQTKFIRLLVQVLFPEE